MSDIHFTCSHCGQHIACDVAYAGRQVACPECQQSINIPGVAAIKPSGTIRYFYADVNNQPQGPYESAQLEQFRNEGVLANETFVIPENGQEWKPLAHVLAVAKLPPPPPPIQSTPKAPRPVSAPPPVLGSKECPQCGLVNPREGVRCDCGYSFNTAEPRRDSPVSEPNNPEPVEPAVDAVPPVQASTNIPPVIQPEPKSETAAEQNDASQQFDLGVSYYTGKGVQKDLAEAAKWFRKAAEQGHAKAQCSLGCCYAQGEGVEKNPAEAVKWLRKAAGQGHAKARFVLGVCYKTGQGVKQDHAEAVRWFRMAAEQGYSSAQHNLGECYAGGQGVEKDLVEAAKWFRKAAEQGHAEAQSSLNTLTEEERKVNANPEEGSWGETVRGYLYWFIPIGGFCVGFGIGGAVMSFACGVLAFVGLIFADEQLTTKRKTEGFFVRNQGTILEFCSAAVGMLIFGVMLGGFGFVLGYYAGMWIGSLISNRLGWSREAIAAKAEHMAAYVGVLASAANADQQITDKEQREITDTCRLLFSSLGFGDDEIVSSTVTGVIQSPAGADAAAAYVASLPDALKQAIQSDVLRILFCDGQLSDASERWLGVFVSQSGIQDWSLLHIYTRNHLAPNQNRNTWLAELGLSPGATEDQIKSAYRFKALDYHPDRLQNVPAQIRALAEAKMISINQAFQNLVKTDGESDDLFFKTQQGTTMQICSDAETVAACWLCNQFNRVPHIKASKTARCGKCHALLGIAFDPNKK